MNNYITRPPVRKIDAKSFIFETVSQFSETAVRGSTPLLSIEEVTAFTELFHYSYVNKVDAFGTTELHKDILNEYIIKNFNMTEMITKFVRLNLLVPMRPDQSGQTKFLIGPMANRLLPLPVLVEGGNAVLSTTVEIVKDGK